MASFAERLREARRLALLQLLDATGATGASAQLLYDALPAEGLASSRDQVHADLAWLADMGLADFERDAGPHVARITARGIDVARDRAQVPGVARPQPS